MIGDEPKRLEGINFLLAGVGGQGTLLAGNILADVGLAGGYDVKKSEIHGMAQRGGSVTTHVRWGRQVASPMVGMGEVDILLGFEQLEALRYIEFLRPGGRAILSTHRIPPISVTSGGAEYPSEERFRSVIEQVTKDYVLVPAVAIAQELGNARVHNVVLLGVLARQLPLAETLWLEVLERHVPAKALEINRLAFQRGRAWNAG
jgi:indolepyruvate ferredoxin oxidoreductase beta subunit